MQELGALPGTLSGAPLNKSAASRHVRKKA
jgi:hypothetical protein